MAGSTGGGALRCGLPKLLTDPHPTPQRWVILGAGGHGRSVADAIRANGDAVLGFRDDGLTATELVAGAANLNEGVSSAGSSR